MARLWPPAHLYYSMSCASSIDPPVTFGAGRHTLDVTTCLSLPDVNANSSRPYRAWRIRIRFFPNGRNSSAPRWARTSLPASPWSLPVEDPERPRENVWRIFRRLEPLAEQLRERVASGQATRREDLELYEDAILHVLYLRCYPRFYEAGNAEKRSDRWRFYQQFRADWRHFLEFDNVTLPTRHDPCHSFACFRQIQRAFEQILHDIIGGSLAAARLRAAVWQSVFSHDMRRYRRTLYTRMGDFATLIPVLPALAKRLPPALSPVAVSAVRRRRLTFPDEGSAASFRSIFPRSRRHWWNRNCSATGADLLPVQSRTGRVGWRPVPPHGHGLSRRTGRPRSGDSGETAARD